MSCVYRFNAPRLKEETRWNATFRNVLFGNGSALVRLLAVPVLPQVPPPKYGGTSNEQICTAATLLALPYELHSLIFSCLDNFYDTICLGLTNQYFWSIGRHFMHKYYMSFFGRWAKTNIFYAPNDITPDDFPPGVFSADEIKQQLRALPAEPESVPLTMAETFEIIISGHFPYELGMDENCDVPRRSGKSFLNFKSDTLITRLCATRPGLAQDPAWVCVQNELRVHESLYFPPDQPWILRNCTTRQIVRTDALAQAPELVHGPCTHILGLGDAVVLRTGWVTTRRLENMRQEAKEEDHDELALGRGAWAGHCFDIVLQSEHEKQTGGGVGWQDVSEEVARELIALEISHNGPDWLEKSLACLEGNSCRFY